MPDRRALVIGIDHYDTFPRLRCAVNDAKRIAELLGRHDDRTKNYDVRLHVSGGGGPKLTRAFIRERCVELFDGFSGEVVLYFSGHGAQTTWGAVLASQDGTDGEVGVPMEDILLLANRSQASDVVLIIDCCHAGELGNPPILQGLDTPIALIRDGLTIMAASRPNEPAYESDGHGMFTDALAEGLAGGAADHMGNVNAASLFLYADRMFDAWDQRPVYKSHASRVATLRRCVPSVSEDDLRSLRADFATRDAELALDPEYEADKASADTPERAKKYDDGRRYKRLRDRGLIETCEGDDLYFAAMDSHRIRLTLLGRYFWKLVDLGKL